MKKVMGWMLALGMMSFNLLAATGVTGLEVDEAKFSELHQSGLSIQIANSLDVAYYTEDHKYTFGLGGFTYSTTDQTSGDTNGFSPTIFARKNMPFTTNSVIGLGVSLGTQTGKMNGYDIENALHVKPYVFFEYAATSHFLVGASVALVNYSTYSVNDNDVTTTSYLSGSNVQLAILF